MLQQFLLLEMDTTRQFSEALKIKFVKNVRIWIKKISSFQRQHFKMQLGLSPDGEKCD